jgi:hypothetical protein
MVQLGGRDHDVFTVQVISGDQQWSAYFRHSSSNTQL